MTLSKVDNDPRFVDVFESHGQQPTEFPDGFGDPPPYFGPMPNAKTAREQAVSNTLMSVGVTSTEFWASRTIAGQYYPRDVDRRWVGLRNTVFDREAIFGGWEAGGVTFQIVSTPHWLFVRLRLPKPVSGMTDIDRVGEARRFAGGLFRSVVGLSLAGGDGASGRAVFGNIACESDIDGTCVCSDGVGAQYGVRKTAQLRERLMGVGRSDVGMRPLPSRRLFEPEYR